MIFVDASALIAIIAGEPDADRLSDTLEKNEPRLCSAVSVWETVAGLCRSYAFTTTAAQAHVQRFLKTAEMRIVPVGERELEIAMDAYTRFGKGRHRAALNMGDCFAYACAKANHAGLVFKSEDFGRTDIDPAARQQ